MTTHRWVMRVWTHLPSQLTSLKGRQQQVNVISDASIGINTVTRNLYCYLVIVFCVFVYTVVTGSFELNNLKSALIITCLQRNFVLLITLKNRSFYRNFSELRSTNSLWEFLSHTKIENSCEFVEKNSQQSTKSQTLKEYVLSDDSSFTHNSTFESERVKIESLVAKFICVIKNSSFSFNNSIKL